MNSEDTLDLSSIDSRSSSEIIVQKIRTDIQEGNLLVDHQIDMDKTYQNIYQARDLLLEQWNMFGRDDHDKYQNQITMDILKMLDKYKYYESQMILQLHQGLELSEQDSVNQCSESSSFQYSDQNFKNSDQNYFMDIQMDINQL